MFHWSINLSDRQVLMLMAFFNGKDDENGSRFEAVNHMIGDAWDVRAARHLQEDGLISVEEFFNEQTGFKTNRWNITIKGEMIAMAIGEDTESLRMLHNRRGPEARSIINSDGNDRMRAKQGRTRICTNCNKVISVRHKYRRTKKGFHHHDCEKPEKP